MNQPMPINREALMADKKESNAVSSTAPDLAFHDIENRFYDIDKPGKGGMLQSAVVRSYGIPKEDPSLISPKKIISGLGYHPNRGKIYHDATLGADVLNTFRFPSHKKGVGSVDRFLDLTKNLWGEYSEYILDLLASIVQEPQNRIQVMPILLSGFGAGKDTWIDYFKNCIGHHNCSQETLSNIAGVGSSDWGNWAKNNLLCVCSEAETAGKEKYTLGPAIRDKITNSRLSLNLKYGGNGSVEVFTAIIAFTNLNAPVVIPRGDRRLFIHRTDFFIKDDKERSEYFSQCRKEIGDPDYASALFDFLKNRKITNDPYSHAPVTECKKILMQGTNDLEIAFNDIIDEWPCDLITGSQLREKLESVLEPGDFDEQKYKYTLSSLLSKANGGKKIRINGSSPQFVYSLRNNSEWMEHDGQKIRTELERGMTGLERIRHEAFKF